jgi:hypothetical protein
VSYRNTLAVTGPADDVKPTELELRDFMYGAHEGDRMGMTTFLLKFGAHHIDDTRGEPVKFTALMWAVEKGRTDSVDFLLTSGANIEHRDGVTGDTPLIKAALKGDVLTTQLLISRGANLNAVNNNGQTAEDAALAKGCTKTAVLVRDELLLRERLRREEIDRTAYAFHEGLKKKTAVNHALRRKPGVP